MDYKFKHSINLIWTYLLFLNFLIKNDNLYIIKLPRLFFSLTISILSISSRKPLIIPSFNCFSRISSSSCKQNAVPSVIDFRFF